MRVGQKVKLKDYYAYTDWQEHFGETATIIKIDKERLPVQIKWEKGNQIISRTTPNNLRPEVTKLEQLKKKMMKET